MPMPMSMSMSMSMSMASSSFFPLNKLLTDHQSCCFLRASLIFVVLVASSPNLISLICTSSDHHLLQLPGSVIGPESVAFDCHGEGPYVGVSDGRILKWEAASLAWKEFATNSPNWDREMCYGSTNVDLEPKCGRPLGLKFNRRTCELYIADAYFGLLMVPQNGGVATRLAASADGVPFRLTNALDVDSQTGVVYFTDSSIIFQRREFLAIVISGDRTGRLMKYDPKNKQVAVLLKGLAFPNGVALSNDKSFLLVAETTTKTILKLALQGTEVSAAPTIFAVLPRPPDNIKSTDEGEFWVGMNSRRGAGTDGSVPIVPLDGVSGRDPVGVKLDGEGRVLKEVDGNGGKTLDFVSEVDQHAGFLYIGSAIKPYLAITTA